jgi:hypothetical protein
MKIESRRDAVYAARITIIPTGRERTEAQLRSAVSEALAAAHKKFEQDREYEEIDAAVESEGGFLGLGAEWIWLFVALAPYAAEAAKGFVAGAAKKIGERAGEKLFEYFLQELRDRNLNPGSPTPAPEITSITMPVVKTAQNRKEQSARMKARKSRSKKR